MQTELYYLLKLFNDSFQILWPIKFVHQIGGILYNLPIKHGGSSSSTLVMTTSLIEKTHPYLIKQVRAIPPYPPHDLWNATRMELQVRCYIVYST